jgi:THO complex subunit 1
LQHFGKIGTGDVELLVQEIEKEKQEREKEKTGQKPDDATSTIDEANSKTPVPEPSVSPETQTPSNGVQKTDTNVRMEGQS